MTLYDLDSPNIKIKFPKFWKNKTFWIFASIIFASSFFGFLAGIISGSVFYFEAKDYLSKFSTPSPEKAIEKEYIPQTTEEEKIINVIKTASPAVVSIVISKDLPVFEQYYINPFQEFEQIFGEPFNFGVPQKRQIGTEKKEIGGGTGFIVSEDGMILTNKHVVLDEEADYTVFTNDGKKFSAKVLARDPLQDLAVLRIETKSRIDDSGQLIQKYFPVVELGNSDKLQIGQTVITIGNALGEFRNTISVGVISGLGRTITAEGGGLVETIEDVIQTDAAINKGNSGGPLLNLMGEVVGINTATVLEAQNIGFAIPVNKAKRDIEQVKYSGKIIYPFLGIKYTIITEKIQQDNNLPVSYGAWLVTGKGEAAILPNSAAEKAGLKEADIILEFNSEKITAENSLAKIMQKYNSGDEVVLKVFRSGKELIFKVVLESRTE
ncbi:MAG: trypsin-like peptidase domain-containing protein [Candidatus Nealsonbacteria bacterium]|nr:trypsin-like peptidase domain-containing protein [Candidatus Nealsonbacteria bacterium]